MLRKLRERAVGDERGFSLIELLVVIIIVGILAAIALPAFLGQRARGQDAEAQSAARNLVSALESYYGDKQTYVGAASANEVKNSGVFGTANGQATIAAGATSDSFSVVGKSASGNNFTITKDGSTGMTARKCTSSGKGSCPSDGEW